MEYDTIWIDMAMEDGTTNEVSKTTDSVWEFEDDIVTVRVLDSTNLDFADIKRDIEGASELRIVDSDLIGEMHFVPEKPYEPKEEQFYDSAHTTRNLIELIGEGRKFFNELDQGKPVPKVLYGLTDYRMARFAQRRLGFEVLDLTPEADPGQKEFAIFGETAKVKEKFEQLGASGTSRTLTRLTRRETGGTE